MGHINVFDVVGTWKIGRGDWGTQHRASLNQLENPKVLVSIAGYNLRECKANSTPTLPERPSLG